MGALQMYIDDDDDDDYTEGEKNNSTIYKAP